MENRIITAVFKDSKNTKVSDVWQWDYGQILRIQGLNLPTAVEVDFAVAGASESISRIGTTKDGVTDVVIPDSLIETGNNLVAYIYLRDAESGNTEYQIDMIVTKRAKPEAYDTPEDKELFGQAIEAVNAAADRAEKAGKTAQEAATKTGQDAEQTAQDRVEVAKMVETVTDISEQVKKVEDLSNKAQAAATKTEADAQQTAEDRVEVGKMLETVKDVSEQVKTVEESVRKAKESEQAAEGHRTAVEEMKNSVEQTASGITQVVQTGVQEINSAKQSAVREVTQTGTAQKTAVEGAGTQAVNSVENAQQTAAEAVGEAKTTAVQAVQAEGAKQTGNVTTEGTKQVKAVQDKGNEVLQSIPEDFQMQMESKLDKQQGVENKGKALVIGEDGNVAPGEVQSGGGDGIAIINTMSGESPLAIPDSAERVNKRLELGGKTEQVQTTGKNLLPDKFSIYTEGKSKTNLKLQIGNYVYSSKTSKNLYILHEDKSNITNGWTATNKFNFKIDKEETIEVRIETENPLEILPMIREETELDSYEPYTGGKPSPSPEYPQEIKNSGKWNEETQKYEVDVKVTGKNLFDIDYLTKNENYQNKDGEPTNWKYATLKVKPNTTYTVSKNKNSKINGGINNDLNFAGALTFYSDTKSAKITSKDTGLLYVMFYYRSEDVSVLKEMDIQVELGEKLTDYAPYTEQTLTLTSDRPITKWDRLVEQGEQIGWLYQSAAKEYIGDNTVALYGTGFCFKLYDKKIVNGEGYCKELKQYVPREENPCIAFNMSANTYAYTLNTQEIYGSTVSAIKEYLKSHPLHLAYKTETPEFAPLPQSEQNAIRALKTYYPTTVITVDGGELDPDIKVTYTADTKNYIDNKVSAKVASIIRQYRLNTANLLSLMPMETQAAMIENDTNNILENAEEMKHE